MYKKKPKQIKIRIVSCLKGIKLSAFLKFKDMEKSVVVVSCHNGTRFSFGQLVDQVFQFRLSAMQCTPNCYIHHIVIYSFADSQRIEIPMRLGCCR